MLKLTGDPLVMGTVVATAAVPRAIFMLVGGALTDSHSPRRVLAVSNLIRLGLMIALALLTWRGEIELWIVFAIAFAFGLADAFMFPAASAFPPRLLDRDALGPGNSLIQGSAQATLVVGPLLAGVLIAAFGDAGDTALEDGAGLALVFTIDAATFLLPIVVLMVIRDRYTPKQAPTNELWANLAEGLRHTWNDLPLRTLTIMIALLGLVFRGPFVVGIPAFADGFLPEGAAGFGAIMAALGVGSILGTILAGTTSHPPPHRLGMLILVDFLGFGLIMVAMYVVQVTSIIAALVLLAAVVDGYLIVMLITWTQRRVPPEKLGRVMSVIMLASQGLFPISAAGAGMLAGYDVLGMLLAAGVLMVAVSLAGLGWRTVRRMGYP